MEGSEKRAKAWNAGEKLGAGIIEMLRFINHKYTALSFLRALCITLNTERDRREKENPDEFNGCDG